MKCWRVARHFRARPRPTHWRRFSSASRTGRRCRSQPGRPLNAYCADAWKRIRNAVYGISERRGSRSSPRPRRPKGPDHSTFDTRVAALVIAVGDRRRILSLSSFGYVPSHSSRFRLGAANGNRRRRPAVSFTRRTNDHIHSGLGPLFRPRPNLREASTRRRTGPADERRQEHRKNVARVFAGRLTDRLHRIDENFSWDTWTVPVLGGEPRRWLPNASGLIWIDRRSVMFSEVDKGFHMLLMTATESRTDSRRIYVPPHERGMAHRSALSPDRKSVVLVEMDNRLMLPCRIVPFDGSDTGKRVGPPSGQCQYAAWSPDGKWMYFNSDFGGTFHIWRQRFPDGKPEQITFGPTEETGIGMAADGRSLVTSVGITDSRVWIHDPKGERQVPTEGSAAIPTGSTRPPHVFSPDGQKLYYLVRRQAPRSSERELWVANLDTGSSESRVPGR